MMMTHTGPVGIVLGFSHRCLRSIRLLLGYAVSGVNGGGKVDHMGGSIVGLRRWKTVRPATFYEVDY